MSTVDKLTDYADEHPRTVIVALLAVIVVGTIGGGLYIESLRSNLSLRDQMIKERLELVELQHNNELTVTRQEKEYLAKEVDALKEGLVGLDETLRRTANALTDISQNVKISPDQLEKIKLSLDGMDRQSKSIEHSLDKAKTISDLASKMLAATKPPSPVYYRISNLFLLILVSVPLLLITYSVTFRVSRKDLQKSRLRHLRIIQLLEMEMGIDIEIIMHYLRESSSLRELVRSLATASHGLTSPEDILERLESEWNLRKEIDHARRIVGRPSFNGDTPTILSS